MKTATARTILVALLAPVLVATVLVLRTASWAGRVDSIGTWLTGDGGQLDARPGVAIDAGPGERSLLFPIAPSAARYARLSFQFKLERPLAPVVHILWQTPAGDRFEVLDVSSAVDRTGWNDVRVDFDLAAGLFDARIIGIAVSSPAGANTVAVRDARLEALSIPARISQAAANLFARQPLRRASVNLIYGPAIAGRGFLFLIWLGLGLALVILGLRRFVVRETIDLPAHVGITVLVLFALTDGRNAVDLIGNAHDAVALRRASSSIADQVGRMEAGYAWAGDVLRYLEGRSAVKYALEVPGGLAGVDAAAARISYFAWPSRPAPADAADVLFRYGESPSAPPATPGWRHETTLPGGTQVHRRAP